MTINSGGQFTITGTSGHNVILTKTGGSNWNLTMSGSYGVSYATVSYSTASATITPTNSTDGSGGGTNVNWAIAVPNSLTFSLTGTSVGFGTLSTFAARYATSTPDTNGSSADSSDATVLTASATGGTSYSITVNGTASGNSFLTFAVGNPAVASSTGTQQFGMRLIMNNPLVGTGTVSSPYDTANWALDSTNFPSTVATGVSDGTTSNFGIRYICNISPATTYGTYSANLVFVITADY